MKKADRLEAIKTELKNSRKILNALCDENRQNILLVLLENCSTGGIRVDDIAKNFKRFSKAMKYTSATIDFADCIIELKKAIRTDNWRPFFVKTETIVAGIAATAVAGFAFSIVLGGPVGVLGYGLIMAATGSLIDDNLIEKANQFWGI